MSDLSWTDKDYKIDAQAEQIKWQAKRIAELEAALERAANALQKAGEMYAELDARKALGRGE